MKLFKTIKNFLFLKLYDFKIFIKQSLQESGYAEYITNHEAKIP